MQRRKLGRTELELPIVAFGAWAIGGWYWGGSDDARATAAIVAGVACGMDAIDTAPVYGFGRSERVIGAALRALGTAERARVRVLTKAGLRWDDTRGPVFFRARDDAGRELTVRRNARPDSLRAEVEQSLARLGVERIDLLQIHWPDPETPLAESLGALGELRREGKLREIGVSNFTPAMLAEARAALGSLPLASTQERYSLLARGLERELLPWCREHELGVLAYSPLEQGLLTGKLAPERVLPSGDQRAKKPLFSAANRRAIRAALDQHVAPVASRHGATIAQVVLAATAAQPGITCVLAGARSPEQARENAGAGALALAPDEVASVLRGLERVRLSGPALLARIAKRLLGRG